MRPRCRGCDWGLGLFKASLCSSSIKPLTTSRGRPPTAWCLVPWSRLPLPSRSSSYRVSGNIRPRGLIIWAVVATICCVGFGIYGIVSDPVVAQYGAAPTPRIVPTVMALFSIATILFIVHGFIVAAEADGRWRASYPTYFDVFCKHAVQAGLAAAFVGAFWTLLGLSAELFRLIGIEFLAKLIRRNAFWIPTTAVVFSYGIHV